MRNLPKVSDAEWEVMKIIWKNPKTTSAFIIKSLSSEQMWKPATIKSLISRLLNKEVIGYEKEGKEYLYYALIREEEYIKAESNSFLKRVFGGSFNSMILNFVKSEHISKEDIDELRKILNEKIED
ncbi:BlaI/MecI/CopY family transcriptional regulator [Clostridium massiliamazoniense]|uniref:BlaI/MecI/CopY family transcriptional regulator n=1 Tax=Clostridium massiliamazoniense TaxID=1347366 RepID=UPI0006D7E349|nr:BlaI/MecI/CopY family transcriptional regulator [Clostridium massiliamazoniense]